MATRARIGFEAQDGTIVSSYHHWDGYPAGLGYNLIRNYSDADKFREAVALGDASHWGSRIYPAGKHSFNAPEEDVNVYYGRDRGEDNVAPVTFTDFADFAANWDIAGEEYAYVLRLDGTLTMIARYEDNAVFEDAEDEIILRRASAIKAYKNQVAA
jgi:hypothetical protein